jgi:tRNA A-37 threonylcarbamoyl transferase component Bud32
VSLSFNHTKRKNKTFIKTYGPKTPFWKYYLRSALDFIGVRQPVEYYNKYKRLEFEYQALQLWESYSLNVPSVISREDSELHLSIIKGQTLFNIFEKSIDYDIVVKLFDDLNYRHQLAFKHNEPRLCHIDANLRNIMYGDQKIFHIDFEMGREYESIDLWARREISKLLISLLKNLSTKEREKVLRIFFEKYKFKRIVDSLVISKLGNFKKEKKNKPNNQYVLYDLALDLQNCMGDINEN